MSLSTRCPSCATTFKVVPDQLKVSEGWVRCGQCSEVFDANAHLRPAVGAPVAGPRPDIGPATNEASTIEDSEPAFSAFATADEDDQEDAPATPDPIALDFPEPSPPARATATAPAAGGRPARRVSEPPAVWLRRSPAARIVLHGETLERPEPTLDPEPQPPFTDDDDEGEVPSALLLQTADNDEPQQSLYQTAFVPLAPDAGTPEAQAESRPDEAAATLSDLNFVRVAERRAFWQRPLVVVASLAVCLALLAALALQVVRTERDRLAAYLPGLQPALQALCAPLMCQVAPLQQPDAVVIDGSTFNKVRGDLYQFDVEVRNTASVPLAMPSLELTLTDQQDLPLVRRVLSPADLRAAAVLAAGGAWSGSLPVQMVAPVAGADRIAGYRVLAFYP